MHTFKIEIDDEQRRIIALALKARLQYFATTFASPYHAPTTESLFQIFNTLGDLENAKPGTIHSTDNLPSRFR